MKHIITKSFLVGLICALVLLGCKAGGSSGAGERLSKNASYALGMNLGMNMQEDNLTTDMAEFRNGITDAIGDAEMRFSLDEIRDMLNTELAAIGSGEVALDADTSYALGASVGMNMREGNMNPRMAEFFKGVNDVINNKKTRFNIDKAGEILNAEFAAIRQREIEREEARIAAENEPLRLAEVEYLIENKSKDGIIVTPSGLQYAVVTEGSGEKPGPDSTVRVHYEGTFTDGTVFDSSYARNEPAEFELSWVVAGWTEGLQLMPVGSTYMLYVPSELGYGPSGMRDPYSGEVKIPPYSPLIFKVELLSIVEPE